MNQTSPTIGPLPKFPHIGNLLFLILHIIPFAVWLYIMPHGFPAFHARWWANLALPSFSILAGAMGLIAIMGYWPRVVSLTLCFFASFWIGIALAAFVVFRESLGAKACLAAVIGAIFLRLAYQEVRTEWRRRKSAFFSSSAIGLALAVGLMVSQRGPDSDTRPLNATPPKRPEVLAGVPRQGIELNEFVQSRLKNLKSK